MIKEEHTGVLLGGPNDGITVTSFLSKIPVEITTKMWLDGKGDDKDIKEEIITGEYVWHQKGRHFIWTTHSSGWRTSKPEIVF